MTRNARLSTVAATGMADVRGAGLATATFDTVARGDESARAISKNMRDGDTGHERRCPRCDEWWPADMEFFYSDKGNPSSLSDWCKACYADYRSEAAAKRDAAIRQRAATRDAS